MADAAKNQTQTFETPGQSSRDLYRQASEIFPGGVNSPVRAFGSVESEPFLTSRGEGAYLYDEDGNAYIDYINSWGPLVLGHAHPKVVASLSHQAARGTSYGTPCDLERQLAELIQTYFPSMEMLRFVNSGTEAGMSVVRLARAFTKRSKIIKFIGCYHGHADSMLVQAGSGAATLGIPGSAGVADEVAAQTLALPINDIEAIRKAFADHGKDIAAIILEPVAGNTGLIPPVEGYLKELRDITAAHESLLIFDEVMTGFRVSLNGAQGLYGVKPDITMLGKVIGGGLPVGAFGGRKDIMQTLAPLGDVYQAGTLSGNPLAMAAGLATLEEWIKPDVFEAAAEQAGRLSEAFQALSSEENPIQSLSVGTMFGFFFSEKPVLNHSQAKACDIAKFVRFFKASLERGVYFAPSAYEAGFVSAAHTGDIIERTIEIMGDALRAI